MKMKCNEKQSVDNSSYILTEIEINEANQKIRNCGGLMNLISSIVRLIKEKEYFQNLQSSIFRYLRIQNENIYSG